MNGSGFASQLDLEDSVVNPGTGQANQIDIDVGAASEVGNTVTLATDAGPNFQNFTVGEAVNVTFAGDATDDEKSVSVVVVGSGAACAAVAKVKAAVSTSMEVRPRRDTIRLQAGRKTFRI